MAYGIRVSKPGKSAYSTDKRDLYLREDKPMLKIAQEVSGSFTILAADVVGSVTLNHNLGYQPIIFLYMSLDTGDSTNFVMAHNGLTYISDYAPGYYTNSTDLYIEARRLALTPIGDVTIYYKGWIFYDPDDSITGTGSNVFDNKDTSIIISKDGIDIQYGKSYNDDDLVTFGDFGSVKVSQSGQGSIVTGGSPTGTTNIAHGLSGTPGYIVYPSLTVDNEAFIAGADNTIGIVNWCEAYVNGTNLVVIATADIKFYYLIFEEFLP